MVRYLRLYLYFMQFSFSRALEFRFDFVFRIFMDIIYYAVNIAFYQVLFQHMTTLSGWTESQTMVFVAVFLVVDALQMCLFSNNLFFFPMLINKGDLDYYLVRPVSTLFFVSLREFAVNSFFNVLIAIGIMVWTLYRFPEPVTITRLLMLGFGIAGGTAVFYLVRMVLLIPVFWLHTSRGLDAIFWSLTRAKERPDGIFTGWVRVIFTSILPFSLMASFPARLFLEPENALGTGLHLCAVIATFSFLVVLLWRLGLRSYSSASS